MNNDTIHLQLPYPPSANRYWRSAIIYSKMKRPFINTYVSAEAQQYKNAVKAICLRRDIVPIKKTKRIEVVLKLYRPHRIGDLDNRIKVLLDALEGHAYEDDRQIMSISAKLIEDKANPRAEVFITPLREA